MKVPCLRQKHYPPKPALLLDGDIIVYKTCAAAESLADSDDSITVSVDLKGRSRRLAKFGGRLAVTGPR